MNGAALAILIPAFKGRHLARTLASLAAQTDQRFRVYVGDDASPEALEPIVAAFRDRLDVVYHRFPDNLGGTSVVRHWDRVIGLSTEPWLWMFSDDDLVAPECVEAFLAALAEAPRTTALFRFQVTLIDGEDRPMEGWPSLAECEDWAALARVTLDPACGIVQQNVIFRRSVYEREGGFYDFPGGFWSDYLTWPKFAQEGGIRTLARGRVWYRRHSGSITGRLATGRSGKGTAIRATQLFLRERRSLMLARGRPDLVAEDEALNFYCGQWRFFRDPPTWAEFREGWRGLRELWPGWPGRREIKFLTSSVRPWLRERGWYRRLASRRAERRRQVDRGG